MFFKFSFASHKSDKNNGIRIIFMKILSRLILLRSILRIPIWLQLNTSLSESSLKYSMFSSSYKESSKEFFNHFTCKKPIGNMFQCCYRNINSFITYFLSYIFISAIYYLKRIIRNSSITHFLSFILIRYRIE